MCCCTRLEIWNKSSGTFIKSLFHMFRIPEMKTKKLTLWNFYQDSVPRVSDPGDMEQKLWNFYQDSVPHVSDSGDMEQSSETVVFYKFS